MILLFQPKPVLLVYGLKEGQREGEYSDGKQGLCGRRAVVCQLKRLRGPKLLQCPPPAEFFLLLSRLPFSAFQQTPLCDSAAQVQLRLSPREIKNTEEYKRDTTDEFLERERAGGRRYTQVLYISKPKEEPKLHLDLFIKAVCIGRRTSLSRVYISCILCPYVSILALESLSELHKQIH